MDPRSTEPCPVESAEPIKARRRGRGRGGVLDGLSPQVIAAGQLIATGLIEDLEDELRGLRRAEQRQKVEAAQLGRQLARVTLTLRRRPMPCSGRHRRASGAASRRRRGSRRTSGSRAGPSDPGDPDPGDSQPPSGRRGQREGERP